MRRRTALKLGGLAAGSLFLPNVMRTARAHSHTGLDTTVVTEMQRLMREHAIPGMAVAVTHRGQSFFYARGVASVEHGRAVTEQTLFEVGSISKTFTGVLGAYALARPRLALSDTAEKYAPELAGSAAGSSSLLDLATYTAGGLPLQFPAEVTDHQRMINFYRSWAPEYPAGSRRLYSNPSIGLFGLLASRSLGKPFKEAMRQDLLAPLGLNHTYLDVPESQMQNYAYGYTKAGKAVRVTPGVLDAEAYGIKTTAPDLLRFLEAHLSRTELDPVLRRAVETATTAYCQVGPMRQGLGWELYDPPVTLEKLLEGNSAQMALEPKAAVRLVPPVLSSGDAYLNKTGSTNGFGAYAAFVPSERLGIVMLANKNYPNPVRVESAYRMMRAAARR